MIQHVAFEGPGSIAPAVSDAGADLTVVRVDRGDAIPPPAAVAAIAGLVVMGGPMGVHDDLGRGSPTSGRSCARRSGRACPCSACASGPSSWPPRSAPR